MRGIDAADRLYKDGCIAMAFSPKRPRSAIGTKVFTVMTCASPSAFLSSTETQNMQSPGIAQAGASGSAAFRMALTDRMDGVS